MFKATVCFIVLSLVCLCCESQNAVADSIRFLFEKINRIPADEKTSCTKIATYKNSLAKINPVSINEALTQFMAADSQFLKSNKKNGCPVVNIVEGLDSLLKSAGSGNKTDSLGILNALLYLKYGVLDSSFVRVQLAVREGNNSILPDAAISVSSLHPFLLAPHGRNESLPVELYIRRETPYNLYVSDSGFVSYRGNILVQADTALVITLTALAQVAEKPPEAPAAPANYWRFVSILLALGLLGLIWKIISDKKKSNPLNDTGNPVVHDDDAASERARKREETITMLNKQLKEKDLLITKYTTQNQGMNPVPDKPGSRYFFSELMMTAGPRKKRMSEPNADKDLGEDVCGFIMKGSDVLAWVLDGTSDFYCLRNPETHREYFSSRLLAQSIARELKVHFGEGHMEAFDQTMATIISTVKSNWMQAIGSLPDSEKEVLKNNIRSGNFPECATTVLIGRLTLNGELIVYRSGDSKMLVYGEQSNQKVYLNTTLSDKNPKSNDRVFFRLTLTDQGELEILHNKPIFEIVKLDKIRTIIGMSDGIGNKTEDDLIKEYPVNSDAMRTEIIYQLQGTEDDKSLFIVEIKD